MLKELINSIQNTSHHQQNLVEYDDYQILIKELLRVRNTRNKFQLQKEEDSQSLVRINISLQKSNDSIKETLSELERELEYYKHQYMDYKALYETEAGKFSDLSLVCTAKEAELVKTKNERDHAETIFIEKQKDIEEKIAQYDILILTQLETNKKADKKLERARYLLGYTKEMLAKIQMQKSYQDDKRLNDQDLKKFDDHLSDFDMEYKIAVKNKILNSQNGDIQLKDMTINRKNDALVSVDSKGEVKITKCTEKSLKTSEVTSYNENITGCCFSYKSDYILLADGLSNVYHYNMAKKTRKVGKTTKPLKLFDCTTDDRLLGIANDDNIELYDMVKMTPISTNSSLANHGITALCYDPLQPLFNFVIGGNNGQLYFYDYRSNYIDQQVKALTLPKIDYVNLLNTYTVAVGYSAQELHLIDVRTSRVYRSVDLSFMGNTGYSSKRIAVGNNKVIACSDKGSVYSIDVYNDPSVEQILPIGPSPLDYLFYDTQADRIITADRTSELSLIISDLK